MGKLDDLIKKKRKYPMVICDDKELISDIGCFIGVRYNIIKEFSKILLGLGFSVNDEIVLCKYNKKTFSFTYIVNGCNPYKKNTICLDCGYIDDDPMILITTGSRKTNSRMVYSCSRDKKNKVDNNFLVKLIEKDLSNGVSYRRIIDNMDDSFIINYKDGYSLNLKVDKPNNGLLSDYEKIYNKDNTFRNEQKLIDYLVKLEYPYKIDMIYKDICNICFNDVSMYPEFSLLIKNTNNDNYIDFITDKIVLRNGKIEEFVISRNGYVFKIDIDSLDVLVEDKDVEENTVMEVKKLIRTIFNNKNGGNYCG